MGTFSSETSENRHNSGKFETLIALQNDLRWLLLLGKAWNKWGLSPLKHLQIDNSGKFETLIALQNDLRWVLLHSWFSKFPRGRPPDHPTRRDTRGNFGSHSFIQPLRHAAIPSHTDTKKNMSLFARHLPVMIIYAFMIRVDLCSPFNYVL